MNDNNEYQCIEWEILSEKSWCPGRTTKFNGSCWAGK